MIRHIGRRVARLLVGACSLVSLAGPAIAQSGYLDMPPDREIGGWAMQVGARLGAFRAKVATIVVQAPQVPSDWLAAFRRVFADGQGMSSMLVVLLALLAGALMIASGRTVRRLAQMLQRRTHSPFKTALLRLLHDALGLATAFGVSLVATNLFLADQSAGGQFAAALLSAIFFVIAVRLAFAVFLRPDQPAIRLLPISDADAAAVLTRFVAGAGLIVAYNELVYVFLSHELPLASAQFTAIIVSTVAALVFASGIGRLSASLPLHRRRVAAIGFVLLTTLLGTWYASVILLDFGIFDALMRTLRIGWLVLALDRLLELSRTQVEADGLEKPRIWRRQVIIPPIQRSLLAIAGTITLIVMGRVWLVGVLGLFSQERWSEIARALSLGFGILLFGYVVFEALRALSAAHAHTPAVAAADEVHPISRIGTVLPLLNGALLTLCVVVAVLAIMTQLGINTGPLLAGAGIFGLAISFGSQALVRDIVSGIFYMADDAFRVGEYIESGRLKGTVEKIMIRSLRLRHQNGQVHTIPFGQLGAVTNYSRDWSTMKFNLRLARDVDLEAVRKTAKRIGQELLEDAELGPEFIQPLKLQGVADILENAVVCRFKMTVRPLKPAQVQREAIKRLYQAFRDKGIAFAAYSVTVQGDQASAAQSAAASQLASILAQTPPSASSGAAAS